MAGFEHQSPTHDKQVRCLSCQHSVPVRGEQDIICMLYLQVQHPNQGARCTQFEQARKKAAVGVALECTSLDSSNVDV